MKEIDEADRTAELAGVLGLPASTFARTFGAEWHAAPGPTPHDFDSDPSGGLEAEVTPWFLGGRPPQLMARVFDHGVFLAAPEGSWAGGTHTLVYWPAEQRYLAADELETPMVEQLVRDLLRRGLDVSLLPLLPPPYAPGTARRGLLHGVRRRLGGRRLLRGRHPPALRVRRRCLLPRCEARLGRIG